MTLPMDFQILLQTADFYIKNTEQWHEHFSKDAPSDFNSEKKRGLKNQDYSKSMRQAKRLFTRGVVPSVFLFLTKK